MALKNVKIYPDSILRKISETVVNFDDDLISLVNDMRETMYKENGIGLAAPQIGILKRVFVADVSRKEDDFKVFINPEITKFGGEKVSSEEGCLSIPGYKDKVVRNSVIELRYQTISGKIEIEEVHNLLCICTQHEIDHLNGILFIDHLSRLKKELFKKWLKKEQTTQK